MTDNTPHRHNPFISVIVPTLHRREYLKRALSSLQHQSYRDFEAVVINDGGTDIKDIIDHYRRYFPITYIRNSIRQGAAKARNNGILSAKGKYIAYLDDDDIVYPDHLHTLITFLESTSYKVAYSDSYRVFQKWVNNCYETVARTVFHSQDFNRDYLLIANYIAILNIMHEKSCLDTIGCFNESLPSHHDLDLWIRLSRKYEFGHIKKITAEFFEQEGKQSITRTNMHSRIKTLEHVYNTYYHYTTPFIRKLQKKVLRDLRSYYGLTPAENRKEITFTD